MNGRFRSAWIRDASRAGRRESVKLAEARRASFDNGGRPCLIIDTLLARYSRNFHGSSPQQIRKCQRSARAGSQSSDLIVGRIRSRLVAAPIVTCLGRRRLTRQAQAFQRQLFLASSGQYSKYARCHCTVCEAFVGGARTRG